jgi:hypothetical protein
MLLEFEPNYYISRTRSPAPAWNKKIIRILRKCPPPASLMLRIFYVVATIVKPAARAGEFSKFLRSRYLHAFNWIFTQVKQQQWFTVGWALAHADSHPPISQIGPMTGESMRSEPDGLILGSPLPDLGTARQLVGHFVVDALRDFEEPA